MGWWWSSPPPAESKSATPLPSLPPAREDAPIAAPHSPDLAEKPRTLSRDEQAEAELQSLLRELHSETPSPSPTLSTILSPSKPFAPQSSHPDSIDPSEIYPTTMSCRAAFDAAYTCQLPGGQFTNVYRYGQLRNCSELWSNFWFCMRTNRGYMSEEERGERIKRHYWERDEKYRIGPSSEDVWKIRDKRVEDPFMGDFEAYEREMKEASEKGR